MSLFPSILLSVCPSVCHAPYLRKCTLYVRNSIAYNHDFWYTCVNDDISRHFFHFFKIFIFWAVRGVKGQKMTQNEKYLHPWCAISQEQYSIWQWFLVHYCKMMISPCVFFIFFLHPWCAISQERYSIWQWFLVHYCKMMISPCVFFIFFLILIFGLSGR